MMTLVTTILTPVALKMIHLTANARDSVSAAEESQSSPPRREALVRARSRRNFGRGWSREYRLQAPPIALRRPDSPQAKVFRDLALAVRSRLDELAALKPLPKLT